MELTTRSIDELEDARVWPRWKTRKWTAAAKRFNEEGEYAFYEITRGEHWSMIDDLSRGAVGSEVVVCGGLGIRTSQDALERLKLLLLMLDLDDRLVVRENPEWAPVFDPTRVLKGVRRHWPQYK